MKLFFFFLSVGFVYAEEHITVKTDLGVVRGIRNCLIFNGTSFCYKEFRKIPFAKSPVGQFRFQKPIPFGKWKNTLDATSFGPSCIQSSFPFIEKWLPNTDQSEDCLFLNIYVPIDNENKNKSVMIWVHGGGFQLGQGMLYNASHLSAVGDVIVVTINYRLEAFGFLSTGDDHAPGNYGLWDQKLAIEWVKININSFGGNNMSVTLFGQSAGGLSLGLQSLNNANRGLFQRVILQSGVGNSVFSTKSNPLTQAKQLAEYVNCPLNLTAKIIECLRKKSAITIHNATERINSYTHQLKNVHIGIPFAPVIDHDFLRDEPGQLLKNDGRSKDFYQSLDIIIGNSEFEGSSLISSLLGRDDINVTKGIPSSYLCDRVIPTVTSDYYRKNTDVNNKICTKYSSVKSLSKQSQLAVEYYGDIFFYSPSVKNLYIHSESSKSNRFLYLNKREAVDNILSIPWFNGTGHGDELFYIFPSLISNATNDDLVFSLLLIKYWTNFARTGNVNGLDVPHWPKYDIHNQYYAVLNTNISVQSTLFKNRVDFWLNEIDPLLHPSNTRKSNKGHLLTESKAALILTLCYHVLSSLMSWDK